MVRLGVFWQAGLPDVDIDGLAVAIAPTYYSTCVLLVSAVTRSRAIGFFLGGGGERERRPSRHLGFIASRHNCPPGTSQNLNSRVKSQGSSYAKNE